MHLSVPESLILFVYLDVFSNSILLRSIYVVSFNFCATLLWLFMQHILKAMWKSRHGHLGIRIDTAKIYFTPHEIILEKEDQYNPCTHLFGISITLLQLLNFAWFFSSIHRHLLGLLKKVWLNFLRKHPIAFWKNKHQFCST